MVPSKLCQLNGQLGQFSACNNGCSAANHACGEIVERGAIGALQAQQVVDLAPSVVVIELVCADDPGWRVRGVGKRLAIHHREVWRAASLHESNQRGMGGAANHTTLIQWGKIITNTSAP